MFSLDLNSCCTRFQLSFCPHVSPQVSNSRDPVFVCPNYVVVHGDAYELYERRPHGVIPFSPPLSSPYFTIYLPHVLGTTAISVGPRLHLP